MQRRFITSNTVLPIPLSELPSGLSRCTARQSLGIPSDHRVLLSFGRGVKYRPTQSRNFFQTIHKVLGRVQNTHLYVVGLSAVDAVQWQLDSFHPRIHLCGTIPEPSTYWAAADPYLESFPFGSATALLEAAHAGVPMVLQFSPMLDLLATNHRLEDVVSNLGSEEEYMDRVQILLNNVEERVIRTASARSRTICVHLSQSPR
jgi:predicted O-linked N-acetylglucosamine transferase (SPINDLY family)